LLDRGIPTQVVWHFSCQARPGYKISPQELRDAFKFELCGSGHPHNLAMFHEITILGEKDYIQRRCDRISNHTYALNLCIQGHPASHDDPSLLPFWPDESRANQQNVDVFFRQVTGLMHEHTCSGVACACCHCGVFLFSVRASSFFGIWSLNFFHHMKDPTANGL
jgi:hypothetical protein